MSFKLALECPTPLLEDIQPLTDFYWVLTHLVLRDKTYAEFYRDRKDKILVLDNSVNELLKPCSIEDMKKAETELGGVDYIVPPDHLGDSLKTEESLMKALAVWDPTKILPVVQGKDIEEVKDFAKVVKGLGFTCIAVPYDITCSRYDTLEEMARARVSIVKSIAHFFGWVHLLGVTALDEFRHYKGMKVRFSVDTGSPILNGLYSRRYGRDTLLPKVTPTMEQMKLDRDWHNSTIYYNIAMLRVLVNETWKE